MRVQPSNPKGPEFIGLPWLWFTARWTPVTTRCALADEKVHQACIDLSVEWQAFVGRRVSQDLHLFQELCAAKSPDDVLHAWSHFWRQAAADYGEEYSAMAKLVVGFVPDCTGPDTEADAHTRAPQAKAA